jgi:antitoxin YefM
MPYVDVFVSVTEAKSRLLDLVRRLKDRDEVVAITREGVPSVVMLGMERYEGLLETLEILCDQKAMRSIRRSLRQAEAGRWLEDREVLDPSET